MLIFSYGVYPTFYPFKDVKIIFQINSKFSLEYQYNINPEKKTSSTSRLGRYWHKNKK